MNRSIVLSGLACTVLAAAGCSSSASSDAAVPGAPGNVTTAPSDVPATPSSTDVGDVEPAATSSVPPSSEPVGATAATTAATTATTVASAPVSTAPPVPTAATTVVFAGNDAGGAWPALARWDGSGWHEADFDADGNELAVPASDFDTVSVASLGLDTPITGLTYGADDFVCFDERLGPTLGLPVSIGEIPATGGYNAVAAAADWNVQPRPVLQVGLDAVEYQAIGESITAAAGVDGSGGDVLQVVRADLDGNGVEEVLVTFEKSTDGFGTVGDFSIVFARYPTAAGDVVDEVLYAYYPEESTDFPTIGTGGLLAVADLNGDAVMEVVLRSRLWETSLVELFSFVDGSLESVASTGCGL